MTGRWLRQRAIEQLFEPLYLMFDFACCNGRGVMLYAFADTGLDHKFSGHSCGASSATALMLFALVRQASPPSR